MDAEQVVVAVMASTGLSYDDAAERVTRAIIRAQFEDLAGDLQDWERNAARDNRLAKSLLKVRAALEAIEGLAMAPKSEAKSEETNPKNEEVKS